ncbi:hypothetical protein Dimus_036440, partial [Dionaea muscipula]
LLSSPSSSSICTLRAPPSSPLLAQSPFHSGLVSSSSTVWIFIICCLDDQHSFEGIDQWCVSQHNLLCGKCCMWSLMRLKSRVVNLLLLLMAVSGC